MITHISIDLDNTLITRDFDHILWNEWLPRHCAQQHGIPLPLARDHVFAAYYHPPRPRQPKSHRDERTSPR